MQYKDTNSLLKQQQINPKKNLGYDFFNKDANYIKSLLYDSWGLSFSGNTCTNTDSIKLYSKDSIWWVKNFNPAKNTTLPQIANFEGLIFHLTKDITNGKQRIAAQRAILARLSGVSSPPTSIPTQSSPNTRKSDKKPLEVEFCDLSNATLDYFSSKGGISIGTLQKYGVKTVQRIQGRKQYYVSFGWWVGDNLKVKRPKHTKYPYLQKRGLSPYVFGFEQLPQSGGTLVICGGETDCLCINEHCNGNGVWAVCLASENDVISLNDSLINELKTRFERVFVLYDADELGYTKSRELATKTGFIWVNTALYLSKGKDKDICDVFSGSGSLGVQIMINHCTGLHTRINAVKTDKFSLDIPFVYNLDFDQYLGEKQPLDIIKSLIVSENHLAIQSPAGTGKSTMIQELCSKDETGTNFVKQRLDLSKTIVAAPTTAIALQLQKDFENKKVSCSIIYNDIQGNDLENARFDSLVITTYDSIKKVLEFVPNSLLIIDEFHQIANDYDYRKIAMGAVWGAMNTAPKVVLLSATPNYLFCSHLAPFFDYALLVCYPKTTNKIDISLFEHTVSKKYLNDFIEENAPTNKGTVCVKYDSNTTLETYFKNDLKRGLKVEHFTSKGRERKEDNPNYISIMETGKPVEMLDKLYFTTLLEAGVSLKFPVPVVAIFDVKSWSKIVQLATRPRMYKSGGVWVNSALDVWIFSSQNRHKEAQSSNQTLKERWGMYYEKAGGICDKLNSIESGERTHLVSTDLKNYCVKKDGVYIVDVPAILNKLFQEETSETDTQTLLNRIIRFDKRFSIKTVGEIGTGENEDLRADFEAAKANKEAAQIEFFNLLDTSHINTIDAVLFLTKDKELKANAKVVLGLPIIDKGQRKDFIQANKTALSTTERTRIIRDLVYLVGETNSPLKDAIQKVIATSKKDLTTEKDTTRIKQRIKAYKAAPKELDSKDLLEVERYKLVTAKFKNLLDNVKKGKVKGEFTACELAKITNKALDGLKVTGYNERTIIKFLSLLYEVERRQTRDGNGKQIYIYNILSLKK